MKVYVIVGLDKDGNIDTAGGFVSKSEAWDFFLKHELDKKIPKAIILPVEVKEPSNETPEATRQV
jgi:hypothetical protein